MERYQKIFSFRAATLASPVNSLAISPDGCLLAVCSDDHRVHVVSVKSLGRVHRSISTHLGPMSAAQWAATRNGGFWLFTAGHRGVVCAYRVRLANTVIGDDQIIVEEDVASPVTLGDEEIVDMVLDTFAQNLAVVSPTHVYMLQVNVSSNGPLTLQSQYPSDDYHDKKGATASAAAFCADEGGVPILVVAYIDSRTLRAFKIKPWTMLWERHTGFKPATLAWVPERRYLLAFCLQSLDVKVLELQDAQLVQRMKLTFNRPNTRFYSRVVCSADHGRLALCGSDDGVLVGWDLSTGEQSSATLDHGRGELGLKDSHPGLQSISSRAILTASKQTNMIAGASHSNHPVVMLWEMDNDRAGGRSPWARHVMHDILCLLLAFASGALCHKLVSDKLIHHGNISGVSNVVRRAWTSAIARWH